MFLPNEFIAHIFKIWRYKEKAEAAPEAEVLAPRQQQLIDITV